MALEAMGDSTYVVQKTVLIVLWDFLAAWQWLEIKDHSNKQSSSDILQHVSFCVSQKKKTLQRYYSE